MVTSFFGRHSFGGDAVYIERLSEALLRRGHEVHVVHSTGAFDISRDRQPLRAYRLPPGLVVHNLGGGLAGAMGALWSHQTGGMAFGKRALEDLLGRHAFDVVHLHNISLLGGRQLTAVLMAQTRALKCVTAHDYWWVCPQSLLWKYGRRVCDAPACFSCSILARRPPQLWRRGGWAVEVLASVDVVLFPSRRAMEVHKNRGLRHPRQRVLPGLIPADWATTSTGSRVSQGSAGRPYFAAAGRLVMEKGFHTLIPLMRHLPECELRIAGSGPAEGFLSRQARGLPNVKFLGLLDSQQIHQLFQGARAVVVPSLFEETFGLVATEALSLGTPVIARNRGSLPELIGDTSGGLTFDDEMELLSHLRRIASDDSMQARLSHAARTAAPCVWFEEGHTEAYLEIISEAPQGSREAAPV